LGVVRPMTTNREAGSIRMSGEWLPPLAHSPRNNVGGAIVSHHQPCEPNYRGDREGDAITALARCRDRTVANGRADDTQMTIREENCARRI
jgi:hypothetical protein